MKRVIAILLILFLCGCTVVRIDTDSLDTIINVVLKKQNKMFNRVGKGYKYYVPKGVQYVDTNDLNEILYSNGYYYYLYIDAVSYYNDVKPNYKIDKDAYYSRIISKEDGFTSSGYINITKKGDLYLVNFEYNYAKIEALVKKKDINDTVLNSAYILSTVKFNYDIIDLMLDEEYFTSHEEKYNVLEEN